MALINCPECGKEISDKSEKCIHCGYPIRNIPYLHENINGKDYDVSFLLDNSMSQVKKMKHLTELSGCDLLLAKQIVLKYCPTKAIEQKSSTPQLTCPKCGSTNITEGTRGFTLTTGFIGSGKFRYVCKDCGNKWKPGSMLEILQRANNGN